MHVTATSIALFGTLAVANLLPRQTQSSTATADFSEITALTDCHPHETDLYCMDGNNEYSVDTTITASDDHPESLTGCHPHQTVLYCYAPGVEEEIRVFGSEESGHGEGDEEGHDEHSEDNGSMHCHSHGGAEHCVGGSGEVSCDAVDRDYNVNLRVGLLFAILATSAMGVFGPIFLHKALPSSLGLIFTVIKQFGTGIIISTAFVHLYTHATLMFANDCVGVLDYEATTSAIVMAGLFLSFLVEYIGHRFVLNKQKREAHLTLKERKQAVLSSEVMSILVLEVGIIFHSLLIGLTLVVTADQYFWTLFVVILFHQVFEGLALGTRIATVGTAADTAHFDLVHHTAPVATVTQDSKLPQASNNSTASGETEHVGLTMRKKLSLAALFAFTTPLGMAIGIGVLDQFNGRDPSTILAIGTLDALSAGILIWVGVVEMWASDWVVGSHGQKAELADAGLVKTALAMSGLLAGMIIMSVLGKWA